MKKVKKYCLKISALFLSFVILLNSITVPLILAQDAIDLTPTPIPTSEVTAIPTTTLTDLPTENPTEIPLPTDTPIITETPSLSNFSDPSIFLTPTPTSEVEIITGDAGSSTVNDNTVGSNQDIIEGNLDTPAGECTLPEGQTTCPQDPVIVNENNSDVGNTAVSSADTGEVSIVGAVGGVEIQTGNATATAQLNNEINNNTVILEPSIGVTPTVTLIIETPTITPTPTVTPVLNEQEPLSLPPVSDLEKLVETTGSEPQKLIIDNQNIGDLNNNVDVEAQTGNNIASENLAQVTVNTGEGTAWANLINLLNTNVVGSNFEILFLDIKGNNTGEIDLNEIWQELINAQVTESIIINGGEQSSNLNLIIRNFNLASLENNVNVCVVTGQNAVNDNGGNVAVNTGDATALANVNNFVNTNIIGTKFFFGVVNILDPYGGNIILPRPENFAGIEESVNNGQKTEVNNLNSAGLDNNINTLADSGNNSIEGNVENKTNTGNATAISNNYTVANMDYWKNNWFFLWLNNMGNWNGKTLGWSDPAAVEESDTKTQQFQIGTNQSENSAEELAVFTEATTTSTPLTSIENINVADIKNEINTQAISGQNEVTGNEGGVDVFTGNSIAISNLVNFVNLNIISSRWFMGMINVMAKWSGNIVFAYPDLTVDLTANREEVNAGDKINYTLTYKNQGYDEAKSAVVEFELPKGVIYLGDNSGKTANCSLKNCTWEVGNLPRGMEDSFTVEVKIDENFWLLGETSLLRFFIPQVFAADNSKDISAKALIYAADPESDVNNNQVVRVTRVEMPQTELSQENSGKDQRQPSLEISVKNNVNNFVYSNDTVSFEVKMTNNSDVEARDVKYFQEMHNGIPGEFGEMVINVGTIKPRQTGTLTFGIKLEQDFIHNGKYYTVSQITGLAPNGNEILSNEVNTEFNVRIKSVAMEIKQAKAVEEEISGEVLGAISCSAKESIFPYLLLIVLSSWFIVEKSRKLINQKDGKTKRTDKIGVVLEIATYLIMLVVFFYSFLKIADFYGFLKIGFFNQLFSNLGI